MANYETLIPVSLYNKCIPTDGKYDFLCQELHFAIDAQAESCCVGFGL